MLNKKYRLKSNSSFRATFYQNKVVSDEFFTLYAGKLKSDKDFKTRFGFVVSKKIDKRAVVRNKIRRRLQEAGFLYLNENGGDTPYMSLIFKAKENSKNASFNDIVKSVNKLIGKIANKFI